MSFLAVSRYSRQKSDEDEALPAAGSAANARKQFETQNREKKMEKRLSFTPEKGGAAAKAAMFEQGQENRVHRFEIWYFLMDYLSYCRPVAKNFVFGGDRGRGGGGGTNRHHSVPYVETFQGGGGGGGEGGQH